MQSLLPVATTSPDAEKATARIGTEWPTRLTSDDASELDGGTEGASIELWHDRINEKLRLELRSSPTASASAAPTAPPPPTARRSATTCSRRSASAA